MKREITISVCAAVLLFLSSACLRAQENSNSIATTPAMSSANINAHSAQDRQLAQEMVPAHAELLHRIDARKSQTGKEIQARLQRTIQLKNGHELPDGTLLMGKVVTDTTSPDSARLAIRFDQAQLKDGSTLPIKAMIVSIQPPQQVDFDPMDDARVPTAQLWNSHTYVFDQVNAVSGADLHSNVASNNSATLSTNSKDNIVIGRGAELDMVIAPV